MKRAVAFSIAIMFLIVLLSACDTQRIPAKAPSLNIALFVAGDLKIEDIQAAQLTTSWTDSKGGGYEADSLHPLQIRDYSEITFDFMHSDLENSVYELEIQFGDKYPPQSVSVLRWNAIHMGTDSNAVWDDGETVELIDNRFSVENNGCNYVYEVMARWENGNSRYAFCTKTTASLFENSGEIDKEAFPPSFDNAKSIKITIYGGTATGQSYTIERDDDKMMWSKDEFLSKYDATKPNQPFLSDPTFSTPNEYLFDALLNAMFSDRKYSPVDHNHSNDEGHYSISIYDDTGLVIMTFDMFYMSCISYKNSFYFTAPNIDSAPFQASYFMNR